MLKKCWNCGTEYDAPRRKRKFCSRKCSQEWEKRCHSKDAKGCLGEAD